MTAVPLPTPRRREELPVPQAITHQHNYGPCVTQWCPKFGVTGKFRRCQFTGCGVCQFC